VQHIAFRVDSSAQIGIGHFMRCLTLADALSRYDAKVCFVSRHLSEHLCSILLLRGYEHVTLTSVPDEASLGNLTHAHWLGVSQESDASACIVALSGQDWDWLIVDHYALDSIWENMLKPYVSKLMVIDDLADRSHSCDVLLDQTFGREQTEYQERVPSTCQLLCGSRYALLRPEFPALREYSLMRRESPVLKNLLITMGGVDKDNATGKVLTALASCDVLPAGFQSTIVMGSLAPCLSQVKQLAKRVPWSCSVLVNVSNMAQLMADCDFAIGAAGATSWERCCLGLPTLILTLADNQKLIASKLQEDGAVIAVDFWSANFNAQLSESISAVDTPAVMQRMSQKSSAICDGVGVNRVLEVIDGR